MNKCFRFPLHCCIDYRHGDHEACEDQQGEHTCIDTCAIGYKADHSRRNDGAHRSEEDIKAHADRVSGEDITGIGHGSAGHTGHAKSYSCSCDDQACRGMDIKKKNLLGPQQADRKTCV